MYKVCKLFGRWIKACQIDNFKDLENLILLEQFKRTMPKEIQLHLDEREVKDIHSAAILADSYALTHKKFNVRSQGLAGGKGYVKDKVVKQVDSKDSKGSRILRVLGF